MTNGHEVVARQRKVNAILDAAAGAFGGKGFTADQLSEFDDTQWSMLTAVASEQKGRRFGDPSQETRDLVLSSLRVREADVTRAPDPFVGTGGR